MDIAYEYTQEYFIKQYNQFLLGKHTECEQDSTFSYLHRYENMNLRGLNFKQMSFEEIEFINCSFFECNFDFISFKNCRFKGNITFKNCSFKAPTFCDCYFSLALFRGCRFEEVSLFCNDFGESIFHCCSFNRIFSYDKSHNRIPPEKDATFINSIFVDNNLGENCKALCSNRISGFQSVCPEEGAFIGFKKAITNEGDEVIIKLLIPEDAKRSSSNTRKCRCDKAKVLSITSLDGETTYETAESMHDAKFIYIVGDTVSVDNFDIQRWNECSTGIHFFITRQEAIDY